MRLLAFAAGLLAAATVVRASPPPAPQSASQPTPAPVQVMVLGAYHFGNPGLDIANVAADDPTSPRRQAELARVADALARFRPTKVMVERVGAGPRGEVAGYAAFTPADLRTDKDEGVQIGYRLAHRLGHRAVYGIDERGGPGKPDYFPFGPLSAWAEAHGRGDRVRAVPALAQAQVRRMEAAQRRSIADALLFANSPAANDGMQRDAGYALLSVGAKDEQPGAELNGAWYLRNAKIFAKLTQAAEPGDRVLVVFGAGHGWWLRHFARETPGFVSVDPTPFLRRAR